MPTISSLILTGKSPVIAYTASVNISGSVIADGLGNQITFLQVSSSYSHTASIQTSWEESSSFASHSFSSSHSDTSSFALIANNVIGSIMTMPFLITMSVDFNLGMFHTSSFTGSTYITASNIGPGKMASLKMTAVGVDCPLTYPSQWLFIGNTSSISMVSSSKTAILGLTSYGNTDNHIVATFVSQV